MRGEIPIPASEVPQAVQAWIDQQRAKFERPSISFGSDLTRLVHDDIPISGPIAQPAAKNLNAKLDAILATIDSTPTPRETMKPTTPIVHADSAELAAANTKLAALQKQIAEMQKRLPAEVPADQKGMFVTAQANWERVAEAFGDGSVRRPLNGETLPDYNRALMNNYKTHSKPWAGVNLYEVPDEVLNVVIDQVHADALAAAKSPTIEPGKLTMRQRRDAAGRLFNEFHGDIGVMLDLSRNPRQYVTGFPALR